MAERTSCCTAQKGSRTKCWGVHMQTCPKGKRRADEALKHNSWSNLTQTQLDHRWLKQQDMPRTHGTALFALHNPSQTTRARKQAHTRLPTQIPPLQTRWCTRHCMHLSQLQPCQNNSVHSILRNRSFKIGRNSCSIKLIGTSTESQTKCGDRSICLKWKNKEKLQKKKKSL